MMLITNRSSRFQIKMATGAVTTSLWNYHERRTEVCCYRQFKHSFPRAIGLKYRSSSGAWRGVRAEDNVLEPPHNGWGETIYMVTESDEVKRRSRSDEGRGEKRKKTSKLLDDLIVFGLAYTATNDDLKEYFEETCGELAFYEVKFDRQTKRSRGFGFIRFKTEASAKEALSGYHEIHGRKLVVKVSEKKQIPLKLFVGRVPRGATHDEVKEYFSEFGDLDDVFVPAGRGFAFITYASEEDGRGALRMNHTFQGSRLNVTIAEPKEERPRREEFRDERSNYSWKPNGSGRDRSNDRLDRARERSTERYDKYSSDRRPERSNDRGDRERGRRIERTSDRRGSSRGAYGRTSSYEERREERRRLRNAQAAPQLPEKDMAAELKNMLFTLLTSQK